MCPTDLASAQGAKVKQDVACIAQWRGPTIRQVGLICQSVAAGSPDPNQNHLRWNERFRRQNRMLKHRQSPSCKQFPLQ